MKVFSHCPINEEWRIDGSSGGDERVGAGAGENGNELEIGDHEGAFETDRHVFSFH
ncbi:hypothetical protein F2Q68_00004390 [Brassica cretica]|uniref:Uncharacterized protein n=1 Tax=Brassica cretica TaxID=69181 RepID=A0A8S9JMR3_BRACR|nr:hypothetical protein F2Q68_00004390 [Brassica cretica]